MIIDEGYDDVSNAGNRILRSVERARAYARGEVTEGFVAHVPNEVDVKAIRTRLGLSQESFGLRFGFSPAAVRDWEQRRRQPEQAARVLLLVIDRNPEAVYDALQAAAYKASEQSPEGIPTTERASQKISPKTMLRSKTTTPA
jgi:putative transcriptional regulator